MFNLFLNYRCAFCKNGSAIFNTYDPGNSTDCANEHNIEVVDALVKEKHFSYLFNSHLTDSGCLQFYVYNTSQICLVVYNVQQIEWDSNKVTQFNQHTTECGSATENTTLCDYGSTECFSSDKLCTFERNLYGDPVHCTDTDHLRYCTSHECPDAFKCNYSYCIAIHMVCDQIADCPDGDDESNCSDIAVRGMFRYGFFV